MSEEEVLEEELRRLLRDFDKKMEEGVINFKIQSRIKEVRDKLELIKKGEKKE